jgi:predicted nucleotidyltransferase
MGVLKVILAQPAQEFTAREVARQAGVSHPQVLEALRLFEGEGMAIQRRFGRSGLWSAVPDHILTERLRGLVTLESDAWRSLVEELERALQEGGAVEAYIFGSVARGTEDPASDIDVLATFGTEAQAARFRGTVPALSAHFQRKYGNELQAMAYGPATVRRRGAKGLLATARREGIALEVRP